MRGSWRRWAALVLIALGAAGCGRGAWTLAKAGLAQVLLERAWDRTLAGEREVSPWAWADTWPVARLAAPRLGVERIVLAGADGSSLAFGPGHLAASARPGDDGNVVLAGHRDTHFAFLRRLEPGDRLELETAAGRRSYRVVSLRVVDESEVSVLAPPEDGGAVLTLLTCYPFDAAAPGGPLRYVVLAEAAAAA